MRIVHGLTIVGFNPKKKKKKKKSLVTSSDFNHCVTPPHEEALYAKTTISDTVKYK